MLLLNVERWLGTQPGAYFYFEARRWYFNALIQLWWGIRSPAKSCATSNSPVQLHSCLRPAAKFATRIKGNNFPVTQEVPIRSISASAQILPSSSCVLKHLIMLMELYGLPGTRMHTSDKFPWEMSPTAHLTTITHSSFKRQKLCGNSDLPSVWPLSFMVYQGYINKETQRQFKYF